MQLCSELPFRLVSAQLRDEREEAAETRKLVALFAYTRTIRPRQALAQLSPWPDPHWPRSKPHNDFPTPGLPTRVAWCGKRSEAEYLGYRGAACDLGSRSFFLQGEDFDWPARIDMPADNPMSADLRLSAAKSIKLL
jgi:hypothetical protein